METSIKDASEYLGITAQSLRLWLQSGHCPFGDAWKGKGSNYMYYISSMRMKAWKEGQDISNEITEGDHASVLGS